MILVSVQVDGFLSLRSIPTCWPCFQQHATAEPPGHDAGIAGHGTGTAGHDAGTAGHDAGITGHDHRNVQWIMKAGACPPALPCWSSAGTPLICDTL